MSLNRRSILFVIFLLFVVALGVGLGHFLKNPPEATKSPIASSASESTAFSASTESSTPEMAVEDTKGPIELVSFSNRDLDGSPALALTFSKPLDAREKHDSLIQVFEMPARMNETQGSVDVASTAPNDVVTTGGTPVKGAWVVGENPRMLFFPHIKPQTRYVVYVAPGVLARNGKRTTAESRYSLYTAAVSPAYYFASKGMVLPAKQNGGLPVITVNVPEVDIQFLRVKPEQLPAFLERVFGGGNRSCYYDEENEYSYCDYYGNHGLKGAVENYELSSITTMTESVYSGRFLTEQKPNRRSVTFIPVEDIKELAEPGIYIAVMSQPNRFGYNNQVTYFYTSNLGLHTRLFAKEADVYVSSLAKGDAVSGAEVSWLDEQGKILLTGQTNSDGHAHFDTWPRAAKVLIARQGKQVTTIALREPALDLSEFDASGPSGRPVGLFASSGRNLYRPGEQFDISVLMRDEDGHPVKAQPIQAILKAPGGKAQFTAIWKPSDAFSGYYQQTLEIPADAATGAWNLELRADPADPTPVTVYRFNVEEFLPERMKLNLEVASAQLDAEHPFDLNVTGNYLYGAPAAGNSLLGAAQFLRNDNPLPAILPGFVFGDVNEDAAKSREELPETELDDEGKASVNIGLGSASSRNSPFLVRATMSLLESGGRPVIRTIERTYWPAPQLLAVRPLFSGKYVQQGSLVQFDVLRTDAAGKLSGGTFPARLFRENRAYYWSFDDQRGWHSGYTDTDELVATATVAMAEGKRGKLALQVNWGRYRLEINDPSTGKRLVYRFYAGWDAMDSESQGNRPDRVALKLDKPAYREGETARLTITPPHGGEALITVEGDRTLWVKRISLPAEGRTVDIPVSADWHRHDLYVSVVALRPGSSNQSVTPARALGLIYLPLSREDRKLSVKLNAPQRVLPQTPLKVKIQVPEAKGKKAHVTLSAVDAGILNITSFKTPDPISYFFAKHR
ncbi:MAG: alpha-2-macroglobulin family protein, partial [Azoarcus sp.]|nr:alpha-2-macroglobulin family protein [Azoarcus sp.]